jgi:oxygen-independent coproporphyrinogen-3 oxidase
MSGISNVGDYYWQNSKNIDDYYSFLESGQPPIIKILQLCMDDKIRKDAIMRIMCRMGLSFSEMEEKWGIVFEEYFSDSLERLSSLQSDGFVKVNNKEIRITEQGRLFLRNIAMCFDRYIHTSKRESSFSKTV